MPNYTKGKWEVDPDYDWVRDNKGFIVANCTGHQDQRANAKLIAQSPRMAELIKRMVEGGDSQAIAMEAREIAKVLPKATP